MDAAMMLTLAIQNQHLTVPPFPRIRGRPRNITNHVDLLEARSNPFFHGRNLWTVALLEVMALRWHVATYSLWKIYNCHMNSRLT